MRLSLCLISVSLFTSCRRSSESRLVGTGTLPIGDAKTYITYKPDHTCSMVTEGYGQPIAVSGPWRIEGHEIVIASRDRKARDRIVKLTATELQIYDTSINHVFTYRRVK
jgi:hypothetical protein